MNDDLQCWLALPAGAELDRIVAERVMGWRVDASDGKWYHAEVINKRGQPIYDVENLGINCDAYSEVIFRPSTNIAHAWEVVEKMKPLTPMLEQDINGKDDWAAIFGGTAPMMHAPTAPLAICRAALAATANPQPPKGEA